MFLQSIFQLTVVIDSKKFIKIFDRAYSTLEHVDEDKYADYSLTSKGITVLYQDSQYKKKIKLMLNPCRLLDSSEIDTDTLSRKLEKRIGSYFNNKYQLDDFELTGMGVTTDIDVRSREKVSDYMKVIQRVGKVKGFSPSQDNWLDDDVSFCLDGNSNGIKFLLYDLEALIGDDASEACFNRRLKYISEDCEGLLRAEVRLTKPKALRVYTNKSSISKQIADLYDNRQQIFLETFLRIVPFGNFYKKGKAEEIIRARVKDSTVGRKMLWLIGLVPEKKSLLLAQKALNYRRIDKVMEAFFNIEVAPITISKRHDIKKLDNLYNYL
jgi:hypothetical protein